MTNLKEYSYSFNDNILEIFVEDDNGDTTTLATLCETDDMEDWELNNLAIETLNANSYTTEEIWDCGTLILSITFQTHNL